MRSINDGVIGKTKGESKEGGSGEDGTILVPLTSSLYVRGKLADRNKVIVDVGTGYYVEKVGFIILFLRLWLSADKEMADR